MTESVSFLFIKWFFVRAPLEIVRLGRNFLAWDWQFFSIGYFVPRLFAPWHRDISDYGRGFDLSRFLHVWGWNLISRFLGAILRLLVMFVGLVVLLWIVILTISSLVIWYALPVLVPGLVIVGFITPFM